MNKNWFHMNKSQRMQLKAFLCLLGILLLLILLAGKLIMVILHRGEGEQGKPIREITIPWIESLRNVWIMEESEEGILVFSDGERVYYEWGTREKGLVTRIGNDTPPPAEDMLYRPEESVREQLADVTLTNGYVTDIVVKKEKINGRILSADADGIEIEGYGKLPLAEDYKGYRLYDSLAMCTVRDICFGYDFTDLCLEDGKICGILLVKEEAMDSIRVLIKETDPAGRFHNNPVITADTGFSVIYGTYDDRKTETHQAGEEVYFTYDSPYFESDRVWIVPDVLTGKVILKSGNRSQGTPSYRGRMEVLRTQEGIVVINEVLLEEYLYSVVPSEMPASYPGEALKAQAICARTYAYGHMEHAGYPQYGAHLDDSTTYQVYNNILEQEPTTTAVKETYGQLLYTDSGKLAETYYYSTSCGVGSDANVWKTEAALRLTYLRALPLSRTAMAQTLTGQAAENGGDLPGETEGSLGEQLRDEEIFAAFITSKNEDDFEVNESWYRWTYEVDELDSDRMLELLQKRYAANSAQVLTLQDGEYVSKDIRGLGKIHDIYVEARGAGGTADELVIEAERGTYKVITGYNIRYILNNGESSVVRQDGKEVAAPTLLPSSFFIILTGKEDGNVVGYTLVGGGFGHGVGMSQNGAKEMAKAGWNAWDILTYFYEDCSAKCIYE